MVDDDQRNVRKPNMNRHLSTLAFTAVALAANACSDTSTSPASAPERGISPPTAASNGLFGNSPTSVSDFTLTDNGGTFFVLGKYTLTVPKDAVCGPRWTPYGNTEFDAPCQTLHGQAVAIHAALSPTGVLGVEFTPDLRFSPSAVVTLSTNAFATTIKSGAWYYAYHHDLLNGMVIFSHPVAGATSVFDFAGDRSLITHVNLTTGVVWRRIKHFSGYFMSSGQACSPSPDVPECVLVEGGSLF